MPGHSADPPPPQKKKKVAPVENCEAFLLSADGQAHWPSKFHYFMWQINIFCEISAIPQPRTVEATLKMEIK